MNQIDSLLNTPYWIIDILPVQVPKDSPGQYFTIEDHFLKKQLEEIKTLSFGEGLFVWQPEDGKQQGRQH